MEKIELLTSRVKPLRIPREILYPTSPIWRGGNGATETWTLPKVELTLNLYKTTLRSAVIKYVMEKIELLTSRVKYPRFVKDIRNPTSPIWQGANGATKTWTLPKVELTLNLYKTTLRSAVIKYVMEKIELLTSRVKYPRFVKDIRNPTSPIWQGANGATKTGTLPKGELTLNLYKTTLRSAVIKYVMEKIELLTSRVKYPRFVKDIRNPTSPIWQGANGATKTWTLPKVELTLNLSKTTLRSAVIKYVMEKIELLTSRVKHPRFVKDIWNPTSQIWQWANSATETGTLPKVELTLNLSKITLRSAVIKYVMEKIALLTSRVKHPRFVKDIRNPTSPIWQGANGATETGTLPKVELTLNLSKITLRSAVIKYVMEKIALLTSRVKHPRFVKDIRNPTSPIWQGANGATETGTLPKGELTLNLYKTTLRSAVIKYVMEKIELLTSRVKHPRFVKDIRNPTSPIWQGGNGATETGTLPKGELTLNLSKTTLRSAVIKYVMEKIELLTSRVKHLRIPREILDPNSPIW